MARSGLLGVAVVALDVLAIAIAQWVAHALWTWRRPNLEYVVQVRWSELWLSNPWMPAGLLLAAAWLVALRQFGLYDPVRMTSSIRLAGGVSRASVAVGLVAMFAQFLLPERTFSRMLVLLDWGLGSGAILVARLAFFRLQRFVPRDVVAQNVAIVGVGLDALHMAERLARHGQPYYALAGYIQPSWDPDPQAVPQRSVLGEVAEFRRLVNEHDVRVLLFATRTASREEALLLATHADQMGLRVFQVPFNWGAASPRVGLAALGDLQLVDLTSLAYPTLGEQFKRLVDLVVAGIGGVLLLPFLALVALAIRLQDGGPVLFVQERCGQGGRKFAFYKFRSMVPDAEARRPGLAMRNEADGALFKIAADPRITPLGRWLRRFSVDELPQLWNVLRGDMNLVGPRPLPMSDLAGAESDGEIQYWFELRHKVKPGITGPWQVAGRSDAGFREMVQHDIAYVQEWSPWYDLWLMLRTVPAVLRGRGAR